jgi:hypothetical protein
MLLANVRHRISKRERPDEHATRPDPTLVAGMGALGKFQCRFVPLSNPRYFSHPLQLPRHRNFHTKYLDLFMGASRTIIECQGDSTAGSAGS